MAGPEPRHQQQCCSLPSQTRPSPALPCHALPRLATPRREEIWRDRSPAINSIAVPCLALPSLAQPDRALPCRAERNAGGPKGPSANRKYGSLPCQAAPSQTAPCHAAPCLASPRPAVPRREKCDGTCAPSLTALLFHAPPGRALPSPATPRPAEPRHASSLYHARLKNSKGTGCLRTRPPIAKPLVAPAPIEDRLEDLPIDLLIGDH